MGHPGAPDARDERQSGLVSRSPDEIRAGITLVFFLLLHGCYEGFPLQGLRQIVLFPWLRGYATHTGV